MATKKVIIKLRRDVINNYASYPNHIPEKGEVCIVDPTASSPWSNFKNIRIKIGDGATTWENLPFFDQQSSNVFCGYFYDGEFYFDVNHTQLLTEEFADFSKMIFVDKHHGTVYSHNGEEFVASVAEVPTASASVPGIMKLYQTHGQNTDGTMSQKAITDAINAIKLEVDETDPESFGLAKPWDE